MKPLVKYRGGKSREIPYLEKHIPPFKGRFIEPFFGGGAMFFYLEAKKAIINDINSKGEFNVPYGGYANLIMPKHHD